MGDWDEFGDENDFSDISESLDSFDESSFGTAESVDISSTMDAVEPIESDMEFLESSLDMDDISSVDSVMDSVEAMPVEFDDVHADDFELELQIENNSENNDLENAQDIVQNQILDFPEQSGVRMEENYLDLEQNDFDDSIEDVKVLKRDETELWQEGNKAIENTLEVTRDDLRDKGLEDGPEMEVLVMQERSLLQQELSQNIQGDFSHPYDRPSWQMQEVQNAETNIQESVENIDDFYEINLADNNALNPMYETEVSQVEFDEGSNEICGVDNLEQVYEATPSSEIEIIQEDGTVDTLENIQNKVENAEEKVEEIYEDDLVELNEVRPIDELGTWLEEINPNFDPFDIDSPYCNNCGACAYAVYQRLEGNSNICATAENIGYNDEMEALTGMEQISMSPAEIEARLLEQGDGSHAIIGIDRLIGPGHWFNAANIGGKVVAIDGQTGEINDWPPDYGNVINWEMSVKKEI